MIVGNVPEKQTDSDAVFTPVTHKIRDENDEFCVPIWRYEKKTVILRLEQEAGYGRTESLLRRMRIGNCVTL